MYCTWGQTCLLCGSIGPIKHTICILHAEHLNRVHKTGYICASYADLLFPMGSSALPHQSLNIVLNYLHQPRLNHCNFYQLPLDCPCFWNVFRGRTRFLIICPFGSFLCFKLFLSCFVFRYHFSLFSFMHFLRPSHGPSTRVGPLALFLTSFCLSLPLKQLKSPIVCKWYHMGLNSM